MSKCALLTKFKYFLNFCTFLDSLQSASFLMISILRFCILYRSVPEIAKVLERSVLAVFVIAVTAALSGLYENKSFTSYTGVLAVLRS